MHPYGTCHSRWREGARKSSEVTRDRSARARAPGYESRSNGGAELRMTTDTLGSGKMTRRTDNQLCIMAAVWERRVAEAGAGVCGKKPAAQSARLTAEESQEVYRT